MSAHTPGPWRANSSWIEAPQMALRVAAVDWPKRGTAPKSKEEAEANARLIAAAPEMLEALKGIEHFADAVAYRTDPLSVALRGWIEAGRAAIAKAGGAA